MQPHPKTANRVDPAKVLDLIKRIKSSREGAAAPHSD